MGLLSLLISRDAMGHAFSINYKGADTYQTACGAMLTLAIQLLTLVSLVKLTLEMVEMSEPNIQSYERPLLLEEADDLGEINFFDSRFSIGVALMSHTEGGFIDIPEELGRFQAVEETNGPDGLVKETKDVVKCVDQASWSDRNIKASDFKLAAMQKAYCIDHTIGA